jgi:predicted Zn-dependent peptidase
MTRSAWRGEGGLPRLPVEQSCLANGLRIVVQPDRGWPLIASMVCYDAGSRRDPLARAGLAHLCEHLAFEGPRSTARTTFAARIESVGGSAQARTMTDRLCFSATFPCRDLAAVLAVEADRMARPLEPHDGDALEVQRRVLLEELLQRSQTRLRATAFEHIHRCLYPEGHPYHTPPAGDASGVRAITTDDVEAFVASHFSPVNAVLVLVGDLSVDEAVELAHRAFEGLPAGSAHEPDARPFRQALRECRPVRVPAAVSASQAHVAWSVPGLGHDGWYLASLLVRALTAGRSSPLARALVDGTGVAQEIRGSLVTMRDSSTLVLGATAARGVSSRCLEQGLFEAANQLLWSGISEASLTRARKKALSDHYFAIENFERRADLCASLACCLNAPERLEEEPLRYLGPDREAIAAFASSVRCQSVPAMVSLLPAMEAA